MAFALLVMQDVSLAAFTRTDEEAGMNLDTIDKPGCERAEKEIIEGFCLSYDLVKGVCLETLEPCAEMLESDE